MKIAGVIPARYGSTRLPGKPLADICGKPMIWWVFQRVSGIKELDTVCIATDDMRIESVCRDYGMPVIMTSSSHKTGAHRLQEVSKYLKADYYIQLNGDEPLIDCEAVKAAIPTSAVRDVEFGTNIITPISDPVQVIDATNIKVVFDCDMKAVYMSRTPVPYPYKSLDFVYYKHVGIIGYNKKMLDFYKSSSPGRLEIIEGIDTMRFIDYGKMLQLIIVDNCESLSVDTEKDLEKVRNIIKENYVNESS